MTPIFSLPTLCHFLKPLVYASSLVLIISGPVMAADAKETSKESNSTIGTSGTSMPSSPEDQFLLGKAYEEGSGTEKSLPKAVICWTKAAKAGNERAQYNLATLYLDGKGVTRDPELAFQWLEKASAQGNARATGLLGYLTCQGIGTDLNEKKGEALLREAIAKGDPNAMVMLGDRLLIPRAKGSISMVDAGRFAHRTDEQIMESVNLLERAANAGMPRACRLLAEKFALNKSDPENVKTAARWYFQGAWLGDAYCQVQTALEYLSWSDAIDAYPWILLASEQKIPGTKEILKNCTGSLTPPQIEEGKRHAEEIKAWISWRRSRSNS
jgi:TPR repeat protein